MTTTTATDHPNWVEIAAVVPEPYNRWHEQFPPEDVLSVPEPHITVLYGFDPQHYPAVAAAVDACQLTPADWTVAGPPFPGHSARNAWLLPLHAPQLEALFWRLHAQYPNQHYLHEGRFVPHLTLCYMRHNLH